MDGSYGFLARLEELPDGLGTLLLLLTTAAASVAVAISRVQKKLRAQVAQLIGSAAEVFDGDQKAGERKYKWVAVRLHQLVPIFLRPFSSQKRLRTSSTPPSRASSNTHSCRPGARTGRSHRRMDLMDRKRYPTSLQLTICKEPVNMPYLSAVLRLADEVDVSASRNRMPQHTGFILRNP